MENGIRLIELKEWTNDSNHLIISNKTSFDTNAELLHDNKNVLFCIHSIIYSNKNKEYHHKSSYLIPTYLLNTPFCDCKINYEIFSQIIFEAQLKNQDYAENAIGKKLYLNINKSFIINILKS